MDELQEVRKQRWWNFYETYLTDGIYYKEGESCMYGKVHMGILTNGLLIKLEKAAWQGSK